MQEIMDEMLPDGVPFQVLEKIRNRNGKKVKMRW